MKFFNYFDYRVYRKLLILTITEFVIIAYEKSKLVANNTKLAHKWNETYTNIK